MLRPLPVVASVLALALLAPQSSRAEWQVRSEFQLHLTENTFDKIIQDFWQSLQGSQRIPVGNVPVDFGDTHLAINGINVALDYSFPQPKRIDPNHREWELKSDKISGRISVDQLVITQHKTINVGGIEVGTTITVVCDNVALTLPEGMASVNAVVRAEVAQNQVQLTMPSYSANWPGGAWQLSHLNCPALAGVGDQVQAQILGYLSSFENLNASVSSALTTQFTKWSQQASLLLLSQQELPTKSDYLKIFYEPQTARENNGDGLILGGVLRFYYPYLAEGQDLEQDYPLPADAKLEPQSTPQLIVPFAAIKALMMGEYFAGQLEYTLPSPEVAGFGTLMNSFWMKLFAWPDLLRFPKDTTFLFQFLPMGPPNFENETAGEGNTINGDLTQSLSMRMFAPKNGQYTPYVEFRTLLSGAASLALGSDGKINFKINSDQHPVNYAFSDTYKKQFHPNTHIAINTIASTARKALSTGLQLTIPTISVGASLALVPTQWALQKNSVLRLGFNANSRAEAPASTSVKTSNGKKLSVTSAH